jgi:hypothetical protein
MKRALVEDVLVMVNGQRQSLAVISARGPLPQQNKKEFLAIVDGVEKMLAAAARAAKGEEPNPGRWLPRFWSGRQLEASYPSLHAAQVQFVDLYTEAEVTSAIPAALSVAREYLDRDDPRRIAAEEVPNLTGIDRRAGLKAARESGYRARDLNHKQQRTFRNALIVATMITILLVGGLVGVLVARPDFAPLCFQSVRQEGVTPIPSPSPVAGNQTDDTEQLVYSGLRINCPTGAGAQRRPNHWDVVLVAFFGVVGASLAAAVTVRGLQVTTSPYDVPLALSLLKLPLGALTAFIGLIAIQGGLIPGLSALDSPAQILAYSVLLGYAQQLATTFLDRRASNLGRSDSLPSNAGDAAQRPSGPPGPPPRRQRRAGAGFWRRLWLG